MWRNERHGRGRKASRFVLAFDAWRGEEKLKGESDLVGIPPKRK
jgi:hypothetical protein